jgi:hypothetical protein
VDHGGGEGDAGQYRQGPVAGGEGEGHELALVAEFGGEDDAEAEQERLHQMTAFRAGGRARRPGGRSSARHHVSNAIAEGLAHPLAAGSDGGQVYGRATRPLRF